MHHRKQKKSSWLKWMIAVLVIAALYVYFDYRSFVRAPKSSDKQQVSFVIKPGTASSTVARNLAEKKLITSERYATWYLKLNGLDTKIKAGRYFLSANMSPQEIIAVLTEGKERDLVITIPEGFTIKQIDARLAELNLLEAGAFIECTKTCRRPTYPEIPLKGSIEGYLFPDTYFMKGGFTAQDLFSKMLHTFHKRWDSLNIPNTRRANDIVKMASIVEREVRTDPDLPIVAGILWKRLDNRWTLGADATIIYETERQDITRADLAADSPYNTRKVLGLPPTAISNPGLKSLKATAFPKSSKYWFYITDKTGRVIYAVSNREHEGNIQKYLR